MFDFMLMPHIKSLCLQFVFRLGFNKASGCIQWKNTYCTGNSHCSQSPLNSQFVWLCGFESWALSICIVIITDAKNCEEVVVGTAVAVSSVTAVTHWRHWWLESSFSSVHSSAILADVASSPSSHLAPIHCTPRGYHQLLRLCNAPA